MPAPMKPIASRPELPLRVAGAGLETTRLISRGRSSVGGRGVLEQHAHRVHRARGHAGVDGGRLVQREPAGDEGFHLDLLARDEVEEALQVAPLRPPHVTRRVVDAVELVAVVVAPGAVGPGEPDVEFLVVVGVPRQVQARLADVDDVRPVPGQPGGGLDRPVGRPARGQEQVVGAAAARYLAQRLLDRVDALVGGRGAQVGACLLGRPAALLEHVQAGDPDPRGDQEPDHQLADQAETDDAGGVAELDLGPPHPVHGDGAHGGEGGVLGQDPLGHHGAQVGRDPVVLRVQRVLVARGRDQVADPEFLRARSHLDHDPAQRVAERRVRVEPVHHLLIGGDRALLGNRVENLAHLIRPRSRLADHRHLGLGQLHHLGAGGDEREQRLDEHAAGTADRGRHVEHAEFPGFVVLRYLLHCVLLSVVRFRPNACGRRLGGQTPTPMDRTFRYHSSSDSSCHICLA